MNTANEMNKSGSKSCNTMSKEEKARMAWEALKNKRMVFCGKAAALRAAGHQLIVGDVLSTNA